jgi:hypothetical protein
MTDDQAPDNGTEVPHHPSDEVEPGWPWSFILLVVAGAAYLVFRFVEFVAEIIN